MLSELWGFEFERRLKPLENTLDAFAFRTRLLCAAKVMSTCQHASLLRLQPHYVYILGSSKGAVTTALQAHSTHERLIGVKKDRSPPTPCHPPSPGVIPQVSCPYSNKESVIFFFHCVWPYFTKGAVTTAPATLKERGYNRSSNTFSLCVAEVACVSPLWILAVCISRVH